MSESRYPLLIDGETLQSAMDAGDVLVVDLSRPPLYMQQHIPGAVNLDIGRIMASQPPVMGLLPETGYLENLLGSLGATADTHIVAYDEESNAKACRLLWTLDCLGHKHSSLLDGGLQAWAAEGRSLSAAAATVAAAVYKAQPESGVIADKQYIQSHLGDLQIVDVRSAAEYEGVDKRAQRGGHIPGAINIEWTQSIDRAHQMRLHALEELRTIYATLDPDRETVVHCQTHQRSSHSYVVLKLLGFTKLRGYPGSWSDWGNDPQTSVESGPATGA
ncbi:MAG: sulfurtransferase [Gammaproteobacteria bacterium]|nr:sulfurtransferase [Gammaproteobacteria bacterium]